jgi:hypothetical protein
VRFATALIFAIVVPVGGCQTFGNDEGARYLQRKDTVTLSAGDASRANAVAQTLHPWPSGVGDRRIPMQGTRAAGAMRTYRCDNAQTKTTSTAQANVTPGGGAQITSQATTAKDC